MAQGQALGQGAFGQVRKAILRSNQELRAIKIIDKSRMTADERVRLMYEIDILKNMSHPNIVKLYEVFEDKNRICLVTELCDGQELFDAINTIKTFSERQAAAIIKEILHAVAYCHTNSVSHRDLKPENILIEIKKDHI